MINATLKVKLEIENSKTLHGYITIENASETKQIIDMFSWENASLILDVVDENNFKIEMPSPPIPPNNYTEFKTNIRPKEILKVEIKGMEIVKSKMVDKKLKVRCVGYYRSVKDAKFHKVVSNWVEIK